MDADYYAVLGVSPRSEAETIRSAWASEQRLWGVRQNAPDLDTRHAAERRVELLGEIKEVLLDPRRRAHYDAGRALAAAAYASPPGATASAPARPARGRAPAAVRPPGASAAAARAVRDEVSGEGGARPQGYAARHTEIVKPLAVGLTGALITGSQVLHWDLALMMAIVGVLAMLVVVFDVLGLRSNIWVFRTRTRAMVSWVVLIALTAGFGLGALHG